MNETRKFTRGEIYYIHSFPTCGSEQRSGRPAIIVSNNENNTHSEVIEVCYLTLKEKNPLPTHVFIDRGPCLNSTILCEQITSVSVDRIGDYMCRIPEHLEEALNLALMTSLALTPTVKVDPKTASSHVVIEKMSNEAKAELDSLRHENTALHKELLRSEKAKAECDMYRSKAEMYERMYNDIIDRLVSRGAK